MSDASAESSRFSLSARWRGADLAEKAWWLGVAAVALLVVGAGWYQAWAVSPYRLTDEQAHIGYVLDLQRGELPTIDGRIPVEDGGAELQEHYDLTKSRYGDVWVANNPPLAYLAFVPPAALTRALGWPGGPLMGVRLANVAFFGLAVAMAARLGRRLGGGDRRIGLVAAGMLAAVPHVGVIAGAAFVDGLALVCLVGLFDALVAISERGPTRRQIVILSAWCALAAGVRPMTAVVAVVAGGLAMAITVLRWWRARRAGAPRRKVGVIWAGLVLTLPTLIIDGWFYARSQHLYGDPTGSDRLFDKFGLVARAGPITALTTPSIWAKSARTLLNRKVQNDVPGPPLTWWTVTTWVLAILVVAGIGLIVWDQVRSRRDHTRPRSPALGWACVAAGAAASVVLAAQHWSGGGTIHPRYLFPALVVLLALVAIPLVRIGTVWAGLGAVFVLVALAAHETPAQNRFYTATKLAKHLSSPLTQSIGPPWLRYAGAAMVAVALVALTVSLFLLRSDQPPSSATAPTPTTAP